MSFVSSHMRESLKDHILEQVLDAEHFKAFYLKRPGEGRMMSTLVIFSPEGIILCGDLTPGRHGNVSALGYGLGWFSEKLSEQYLCEKFLEKGWHQDLAAADLKEMARMVLGGGYDEYSWTGELHKASETRHGLVDDLKSYRKDLQEVRAANDQEQMADARAWIAKTREELKPIHEKVKRLRQELADQLRELARDCEGGEHHVVSFGEAYREIERTPDWYEGLPGWGYAPAEAAWLCAIQQKFAELYAAQTPVEKTA